MSETKVDPLLVHELLHGASLAVDLLDSVGGGETYAPVWEAYPEANVAYTRALDALADFYQAMGRVSCRNG